MTFSGKMKLKMTLWAIAVVALFVLLLVRMVVENVQAQRMRTNATLCSIETLRTAFTDYRLDVGELPPTNEWVHALTEWHREKQAGIIRTIQTPVDAWGNEFRYQVLEGKPIIESAGPDGVFDNKDDV